MSERVVRTITAGSTPMYEIVEVDSRIRIRAVSNPNEYIDLIATVLPQLIQILQEVDEDIKRK